MAVGNVQPHRSRAEHVPRRLPPRPPDLSFLSPCRPEAVERSDAAHCANDIVVAKPILPHGDEKIHTTSGGRPSVDNVRCPVEPVQTPAMNAAMLASHAWLSPSRSLFQ
jgi:hypothetical protein